MLGKSAPPTYELGEFLVKVIGLNSWPGSAPPNLRRVAFHPACHGRALHLEIVHTILLQSLKGIELLDFPMAEQCCGFGGAFSTDLPKVSTGIGLDKLNQIESVQPDAVLSTDMGCLMHLRGLSKRRGSDLPMMHFAQYLIRCAEVEAIE